MPATSGNGDLISSALERMVNKLENISDQRTIPPSEWLEKYFWIPEPRDPVTDMLYPPGPIRLVEHQRRIIDEALSRKPNGLFKYTNIIYSAPKKSGKSTLASGVALYLTYHTPYGKIFCLANDGKQADDRLMGPILQCIDFHKANGLLLKDVKTIPSEAKAKLSNKAVIEAIPCDAAGEAGSEPTGVFLSEVHAYTSLPKRKLFTELTIPPTKWGRAIRWIDSYAGYMGVSVLLWEIYQEAVLNAVPHPDFLDLTSEGEPVVWINEGASTFCYWDHEQRLMRDVEAYYQQEARMLTPSEFERIHKNRWVSALGSFVQPEWWDACQDESIGPLLDNKTPVVIAVDAAETNDCAAIVAVTRHPKYPETDIAIRACKIFRPIPGKSVVILEDTIGKTIQEWGKKWNIVCIAYDAFQMAKLVQDYRRGQVTLDQNDIKGMNDEEINAYIKEIQRAIQRWYFRFSQQTTRSIADKQLYDMIVNQQIHWNPNDRDSDITPRGNDETLTKHVKQAGVDQTKGQYRIKKLSNDLKIDATVALSMAAERCMTLILENKENSDNTIESLYRDQLIDYSEYIARKARATVKNV
jgi:phage terminase large subunit-like protein